LEGKLPAEAIRQQKNIMNGNLIIELYAPCRVNEGILKFSDDEIDTQLRIGKKSDHTISFFIPASGSGSRMFQFLYNYLESPDEQNTAMVERFLNSMEDFAFYNFLPFDLKQKIEKGSFDTREVVMYILNGSGLQLGQKPKGLIPFHSMGHFAINPIQEQILQGEDVDFNVEQMHFTIQQEFENEIKQSISNLRKFSGPGRSIGFSYQESSTDAYAFNPDGSPALGENGELIKRPAGHGALLDNLDLIQEDIILIKNIDNIQHWDHHSVSQRYWKLILSVLDNVQSEIHALLDDFDLQRFEQINSKYQLIHTSDIQNWTNDEIVHSLKAPIRVCGMVRNVGQPGGGPYWVKEKTKLTKQIVEKTQISSEQQSLMVKSTHFNPVMIALSSVDANGRKYDLKEFMDESKYFVVDKEYLGKKIRYCELPGLWNGSMSNWNTVFVEIPNEIFSPVKTVLDLLQTVHQPIKK
jgi:hypothetical protein